MSAGSKSASRLRPLPGWIVFEREEFLDALGAAAAAVIENFKCLVNSLHPRIGLGDAGIGAAADSIQNRRQIEQPAAGVEEELIERFRSGQWSRSHDASPVG